MPNILNYLNNFLLQLFILANVSEHGITYTKISMRTEYCKVAQYFGKSEPISASIEMEYFRIITRTIIIPYV